MTRRALTLLETLISIAVIAILIAIALPAMKGSIDSSRRAVCLSNLKTFRFAFAEYLEDSRGVLPEATWIESVTYEHTPLIDTIAQYVGAPRPTLDQTGAVVSGQPWLCPADRIDGPDLHGFSYFYVPGQSMGAYTAETVSTSLMRTRGFNLLIDYYARHPGGPRPPDAHESQLDRNALTVDGQIGWAAEIRTIYSTAP